MFETTEDALEFVLVMGPRPELAPEVSLSLRDEEVLDPLLYPKSILSEQLGSLLLF